MSFFRYISSLSLAYFVVLISCAPAPTPVLKPGNLPDSIPGEPFNPSEVEEAAKFAYDENTQGSRAYMDEKMFQQRLANKNGLIDETKLWPKFGEFVFIPYIISYHFDRNERSKIMKAFDNFHENTCIRFVPWTHQKDYIYIIYGEGCDSEAGRVGGGQTLSLGDGCNSTHTAIHEINHAVGFWHEHNRPDRRTHVNVYLDNVMPENRFNFDQLSSDLVHSFGQNYDTSSIMHYDEFAFSMDPGNLVVLEPAIPNSKMGFAKVLSKACMFDDDLFLFQTDIIKINKMYHCHTTGAYQSKTDNPFVSELHIRGCEDSHPNCANLKSASCHTHIWMQANCRNSCGRCGVPCQDLHRNCRVWAMKGACQTELDYMYIYCPRSCLEC